MDQKLNRLIGNISGTTRHTEFVHLSKFAEFYKEMIENIISFVPLYQPIINLIILKKKEAWIISDIICNDVSHTYKYISDVMFFFQAMSEAR